MLARIRFLFKAAVEYRDIRRIWRHPARFERIRRARISAMLDFARANTRFYSSMEGSDISGFPVVDRYVMRPAIDDFRAGNWQEGVHTNITSGSTGTPFRSYQDDVSYLRRALTVKNTFWSLGYGLTRPTLVINVGDVPAWKDEEFRYNRRFFSWSVMVRTFDDKTFRRIVDFVKEKHIHVVRGYFSVIEYFTEFLARTGTDAGPVSLFISMGELLTEPVRLRIVEGLHRHVVSIYGLEEVGIIGQSELDGAGDLIRLNKANCLVELLGLDNDLPVENGQPGRVVVTDFTNRAMPFVRYDIGDLAVCRESLPSGEPLVIQLLECRKTDMIYTTSGDCLPMVIPFSVWTFPSVRQVQFVQTGLKRYRLNVNADKTVDREALAGLIRDRVGQDAELEICLVDDIPVMRSGKRRMVIQECEVYLKNRKQ